MEVKHGYKQTDVGVIPEEWGVSTVGQEFEVRLGKMLDAERNSGTPKPYLGNRAVQWDRIDCDELPTVPMSRLDIDRFRLRKGDLLVCEGGEVGRAAIWNAPIDECYYQKALHRLRPLRGFDVRVMAGLLRLWSERGVLANYVTQTSIAHLPRQKFMEVPMPVPPPAEQGEIAEALSDVDALLGGLDRLITKKRDLKQAAMQQLLTGQSRLSGFFGHWQERPLSVAVKDLQAGVSVNSLDEGLDTDHGPSSDPHVPRILKTSAVDNGAFFPAESKKIATKELSRATTTPRRDTIILSRMNTPELVGECAYVSEDYPSLFLPDRLWMMLFQPDTRVSRRWLAYMLSSHLVKGRIKSIATGTSGSMKNISKDALLSLSISFPEGAEQIAIAAALSDMDAELAALEQRRDKTCALKQAMMQELLTGRTRVLTPEAAHA